MCCSKLCTKDNNPNQTKPNQTQIMKIHLTAISSNIKTGPIPVTTSEASTCPEACPFKKSGCYADSGPLAIHWSKVSNGERGDSLDILARQIKSFPRGQVWRHNQAGDLPGFSNEIDALSLQKIVTANKGRRGFTYTHKPCEGEKYASNRDAVASANREGFTINLSANNVSHADSLASLNVGPVVCVVPQATPNTFYTPSGRKGIVCPAQQRDDITCANCQLCQRVNRSVIIGFRPHGTSKKKAESIASK
jgi:hypothetical protein